MSKYSVGISVDDICENVLAIVREEYISKAEYENRLKADMVAMLDKIRAEIEKVFCMSVVTNELRTPMEVKTEILQIIDKYKAESEDKE